jgi:hydroxypyruvate reductase
MRALPDTFFQGRETAGLRLDAVAVLSAALEAADAGGAVRRALAREGGRLVAAGEAFDLDALRHVWVTGGGKAAAAMAAAVEEVLGDRLSGGVVAVKYGHVVPTRGVRVLEAGHPHPDAAGVAAGEAVIRLAQQASAGDLVLVLLSGGGSALLTAPAPGVTLEDKREVTDLLLRAGAPIGELNAVRKHLSRLKGGWLARHLAPARSVTLALSDVLGNPLDVIASGPTVPDPSTFADALEVLFRRGVLERVPSRARAYLEDGRAGRHPETPKPGDPVFALARAAVIADLRQAVEAAARQSRELGYLTSVLSVAVEGEAREAGRAFGRLLRAVREGRAPPGDREGRRWAWTEGQPVCLLQGGETTVTVRGPGRGGRNQEFALGAALELDGLPGVLVLAAGTDGTDGPTDAAGAVADGTTLARARARGLDPLAALERNDAYPFFQALGDLVVTGPTLTNVNDLMVGLVERPTLTTDEHDRYPGGQ